MAIYQLATHTRQYLTLNAGLSPAAFSRFGDVGAPEQDGFWDLEARTELQVICHARVP